MIINLKNNQFPGLPYNSMAMFHAYFETRCAVYEIRRSILCLISIYAKNRAIDS